MKKAVLREKYLLEENARLRREDTRLRQVIVYLEKELAVLRKNEATDYELERRYPDDDATK